MLSSAEVRTGCIRGIRYFVREDEWRYLGTLSLPGYELDTLVVQSPLDKGLEVAEVATIRACQQQSEIIIQKLLRHPVMRDYLRECSQRSALDLVAILTESYNKAEQGSDKNTTK